MGVVHLSSWFGTFLIYEVQLIIMVYDEHENISNNSFANKDLSFPQTNS